jgi:hypothetical protein
MTHTWMYKTHLCTFDNTLSISAPDTAICGPPNDPMYLSVPVVPWSHLSLPSSRSPRRNCPAGNINWRTHCENSRTIWKQWVTLLICLVRGSHFSFSSSVTAVVSYVVVITAVVSYVVVITAVFCLDVGEHKTILERHQHLFSRYANWNWSSSGSIIELRNWSTKRLNKRL